MTKRISQATTVVVPAVPAHDANGKAVDKVVVVPADAEVVVAKGGEKVEEAPATVVAEVAALVAPTPMAMVAAQDAATQTTGTTTTTTDDGTAEQDYTPYIVGGVLLAGGILAIALSSGDDDTTTPAPTPTPTPAPTNAVTFSSATTATVAENAAATTTVIDVNATAATTGGAIVYTLGGTDAALFNIDAATGIVTLRASANFEARPSYSITVTGTSAANGTTPSATATQTIAVTVTNVNEAPAFASATATATVAENSAITTTVFTAAATDPDAPGAGSTLTYALAGTDAAAFAINATTGVVTFRAVPDFETRATYSFTVTATDNATPALVSTAQTVTVNVTNVNEAPTFAAATRATTIGENSTGVVFTGGATDPDGTVAPNTLTYSLSGTDASFFTVNAQTGAVSFVNSPDFEAARSPVYTLNLVATDQGGLTTTQANTVTVTDVVEGPVATTINLDTAVAAVSGLGTAGAVQATIFTDNTAVASNATINNFGRDDIVRFSGTTTVSFSSVDNDLTIQFLNNGVLNDIKINDIVSPDAIITSEASAEAAVNAFFGTTNVDYFRFA